MRLEKAQSGGDEMTEVLERLSRVRVDLIVWNKHRHSFLTERSVALRASGDIESAELCERYAEDHLHDAQRLESEAENDQR